MIRTRFPAMLASALFAIGAAAAAVAAAPPAVHVERAWIRWLPANLPAAGYATIVNDSGANVRLTGAASPAYGKVMLMQSHLADGDSSMTDVSGIDVPAHGKVTLAPGDYHLMLSKAAHPIKPGDTVPMILHFADGATLQVNFSVLPANTTGPSASD